MVMIIRFTRVLLIKTVTSLSWKLLITLLKLGLVAHHKEVTKDWLDSDCSYRSCWNLTITKAIILEIQSPFAYSPGTELALVDATNVY